MPHRKPPNRGGRPSKFTAPIVVTIAAALINGKSVEAAARAAGIGASTVYRWNAQARAGDPRFGPLASLIRLASHNGQCQSALAKLSLALLKGGL